MADWRRLALEALLADGKSDQTEVKVIKKALWADGKIDKEEVEFLRSRSRVVLRKHEPWYEQLAPELQRILAREQRREG